MAASGILIRVDATTAGFDRALAAADRSLLRYGSQLKIAQKSQLEYDAAVAKFGATSDQAVAAQQRLGAALARTTAAEQKAALEAKIASEQQAADQARIAAATEKAAAAEVAAIDRATLASTRQAQAQARAALAMGASLEREVAQFEKASAAETAAANKGAAATLKQSGALSKLGITGGNVGLAVAAGFVLATKSAADFGAQMAKVKTLSGATGAQLAALTDATKGFTDIGVSASQAADAEIELVKAGVSVKDILGGGLQGALQLAAAGQLDVADATSIAAQAMTQFGLAGKDIPHIADLLSAGANKALGSVQDLGTGLSYAGGPAHQLGVSIEDTVATLAEFAQAGLIGEKGGAALQTMFARLVKPTGAAQAILDKYNISLYDSKGAFVGMSALAGEFQKNLKGVSTETRNAALQTIFGNRAFRAAAILYQDGAKGAADWRDKVVDAGNAARTTKGQMDSLAGDFQKLTAQAKNAAISIGGELTPELRQLAQGLSAVIKVGSDFGQGGPSWLQGLNGGIKTLNDGLGKTLLGDPLGGLTDIWNGFTGGGDAAETAAEKVNRLAAATGQLHNPLVGAADAARQMGGAFNEYGTLAPKVADDSKKVGDAAANAAQQVLGLSTAQQKLDAVFAASKGSIAALTLEIQSSKDATKDLTGVMTKNGKAINNQSVAGATLTQNMIGIASAALEVKGTQQEQAAAIDHARAAIIRQTEAAGASSSVARGLADQLLNVANNANKIPASKSVKVSAPGLSEVDYMLQRALQSLNAFHSVSFNVNTNFTHSGVQAQYADGGIREQHVAQIPMPGLTRVWNEPEAGGEAYIPFAPQKRPRSRAIATETVARLGGSVAWHASGAMYGQPQQWRGNGGSQTIKLDASAIRQALNGMTVVVGNAGEVATGVRSVATHAVLSSKASDNRWAAADRDV